MISCDKAAVICSKTQYREAGFRERLQLWMHLLVCKTCTSFSRKNGKLTNLCDQAVIKTLSPEEKSRLKSRLQSDLSKDA
ncbi:MAG: hypothetical protein WBN56_08330 [Robiginitalea sp.]|uniref:hypothetical protein n=1 Tax=Robiginitalea sp. TaxID=1902411 RepID=UPI003C7205AB